jgi:hypothetical protein
VAAALDHPRVALETLDLRSADPLLPASCARVETGAAAQYCYTGLCQACQISTEAFLQSTRPPECTEMSLFMLPSSFRGIRAALHPWTFARTVHYSWARKASPRVCRPGPAALALMAAAASGRLNGIAADGPAAVALRSLRICQTLF